MQAMRSPIRSPISSAMRSALDVASTDPFGRVFLADAATGLLLPGFTYTRSGPDLWCPQADGSLASFSANVIPREWANGRWGFRFDPGWAQILLRTHELGNAAWASSGLEAVVQDGVSFGGSASWKIVESATSTYRYTQQAVNFTAGQAYTITAVVSNRAGGRFVQFRFPASAFGSAVQSSVNPRSGASQALFGATVHPSVEVAGGWLVAVTAVATATASGVVRVQLAANQATADEVYLGDGVSGVNVWGVNVTNAAYPVPFTVAQGTAGTVSVPTLQMLLSDASITLGSEYSFGVEYEVHGTVAGHVLRFDDGADNNRSLFYANAAGAISYSAKAGGATVYNQSAVAANGTLIKSAARIKANNIRAANNGLLAAASGAAAVPINQTWLRAPNLTSVRIGRMWLAPSRALTDSELQAVTA